MPSPAQLSRRLWGLPFLLLLPTGAAVSHRAQGRLEIRASDAAVCWAPDNGDARWRWPWEAASGLETNGFTIRPPSPGADHAKWLAALRALRHSVRSSSRPEAVRVQYRGVRAWIRFSDTSARALSLRPGERVAVDVDARSIEGNEEVCLAFDYRARATGAWAGWSTVVGAARLKRTFTTVTLEAEVPSFDSAAQWAVPIVGQDATHNPATGVWEARSLVLRIPDGLGRKEEAARIGRSSAVSSGLDLSSYDRPDLAWSGRNLACYFLFMYDSELYDRRACRYRLSEMEARWRRDFGRIDSVVLWQAYPRIGVDERNQFDFYRDMPGGLRGLRELVARLHVRQIRSFIAYNPWDTGTRREGVDDAAALARMVADIGADGIFLDTMDAAPGGLREAVDRRRRGIVFEPEGAPPIAQLSLCNSSWAQWLPLYPEPSVLFHRWIEPRHIQHQIRRWDQGHREEIETAYINGSGMLIWENVFGSYNPWGEADKALWRRASTIIHRAGDVLASDGWEPAIPTLAQGLWASRFPGRDREVVLVLNRSGRPIEGPLLRVAHLPAAWRAYDLETGRRLAIDGAGAIVGRVADLLGIWIGPGAPRAADPSRAASGAAAVAPARLESQPPPLRPWAARPPGMSLVAGGVVDMRLAHERRECGCYADPGSGPGRRAYFEIGNPFHETIRHDYAANVASFLMDECLVTNRQFAAFLKATAYRPAEPRNFVKHWRGGSCPAHLLDHPIVYVDLDDARAYARWAGKRLPTEPEWQLAAQGTDGRAWPWGDGPDPNRCNGQGGGTTPVRAFPTGRSPYGCYDMAGNVWQWTESERSDGHTRYCIIRGGCFFDAPGSIWYVHGGAQPLTSHTKFLLMHPGLDRCSTIGFRCAADLSRPGTPR